MAFFGVQKLSVDLPSDQIFDQRILYGSHLHIIFGGDADLLFLLVKCDLGFRLAKIVARQNCFFGDINRVVDLLEIDTADDIKGRHDSFLPRPRRSSSLKHSGQPVSTSQDSNRGLFPRVRRLADLAFWLSVPAGIRTLNPLNTKSKISLLVMIPTTLLFLTTGKEPIRWRRKRPTAFLSGVSGRTVNTSWLITSSTVTESANRSMALPRSIIMLVG